MKNALLRNSSIQPDYIHDNCITADRKGLGELHLIASSCGRDVYLGENNNNEGSSCGFFGEERPQNKHILLAFLFHDYVLISPLSLCAMSLGRINYTRRFPDKFSS